MGLNDNHQLGHSSGDQYVAVRTSGPQIKWGLFISPETVMMWICHEESHCKLS
jgi:hypothetical protein